MKASDDPEISKKWWTSEKPDDIKGQALEKALVAAEKALADADKKGDAEAIDDCLAALASLGTAANTTIKKECDKKKHKEVIAVLAKFEDLIDEEVERLEELKDGSAKGADGEEEEDDEKGVLKPAYLERMIKKVKGGEALNFSFGLDKSTPENSCLVLCNKKDPDKLRKILKGTGEFGNRLITFGTASGDGKVLQFKLAENAKEPASILKLAKAYLKGHRELKFKKLEVLLPDGQSFAEDTDSEGQAEPQVAGAAGDLQQRLRSAATAASVWKESREGANDEISQLRRELAGFDDPAVASIRDRLATLLDGYPDLNLPALEKAGDQAAFDRALEQTRLGLVQWRRKLESDEALRTIDENPFGIKTNVVGRFGDALGVISDQLKV